MRHQCGRLKLKYVLILGLIIVVTSYFLILRERDGSIAGKGSPFVPSAPNAPKVHALKDERLNFNLYSNNDIRKSDDEVAKVGDSMKDDDDKDGTESVNIYVVEEHHEVLPYWYEAANKGVIPKTANTLIHFDGHSDLAPPVYVQGYPFFKWPKPSQLKYLLQSNDVFIQVAVMAGLINRLIWVWPDWDLQNHEEEYSRVPVRLGWYHTINETDSIEFCMCAVLNETYICRSMSDFGMGADENGFEMPTSACKIEATLVFEEVSESYAMTYFRRQYIHGDKNHVLLDIDEDYYGCTYAVMPLLNANVTLEKVRYINKRVSALFCPKDAEQERETDRLLYSITDLFRQQKQCASQKGTHQKSSCKNITDDYIKSYSVSELVKKNETSIIGLCRVRLTSVSVLLRGIFQHLRRMSEKQLKALQQVGFCSSTSPKSYSNEDGFTICIGANTPQNSAVLMHSPTAKETAKRSQLLKDILKHIPNFSPKLVTIARSVRDGYTPKEYFEKIEKDILSMLKSQFDENASVKYDVDLLGGVDGWPARRRTLAAAKQYH